MRYVVLIVSAVTILPGCWTEQEVVTDVTTDTDSDSDSDTDTGTGSDTGEDPDDDEGDTSTDNWCTAPEGITDWGGPCHTTTDCPLNTECIIITGMDDTQGVCAPECCNFSTADTEYCTDVSTGQEGCIFGQSMDGINFDPPFYCLIACNTQADCPTGTDCTDNGNGGLICYGYAS